MGFIPLTHVWARDGEAAVVIAALEDAGFHPQIECDPRGPMHYYGWPLGSSRPIAVLIPKGESSEAHDFLAAECEPSWVDSESWDSLAGLTLAYRRWVYAAWMCNAAAPVALALGVRSLFSEHTVQSVTETGE